SPTPTPAPASPRPSPPPVVPAPPVVPTPTPPAPVPTPTAQPPLPTPTVTPPQPPVTDFWVDDLPVIRPGHRVPPPGPGIRQKESDWFWQRGSVRIAGRHHPHGITVHAPATTVVELGRDCTSFDAVAGVDDLSGSHGEVVFTVQGGDGRVLWRSPGLGAGDPPVPVHVPLAGQRQVRLVVSPAPGYWSVPGLADWAEARFRC
ncbi:NPCBM/NEW2 domain-containing protein, partial [Kitasatospora sp. NPDC004240]